MTQNLRIGIVGTGMMVHTIAQAIVDSATADLIAISSCCLEIAQTFANKYGAAYAFDSWEKLLDWEGIDAVYVAVPTAEKEEICVAAAQARKHVLADKPFVDLASLEHITIACQVNNVSFMDATYFVHHPRTEHIHTYAQEKVGVANAISTSFFLPFTERSSTRTNPEMEPSEALTNMVWHSMRAAVEFLPNAPLKTVEAFIQRDKETGSILRAAGLLTFKNNTTSTWDVSYNANVCTMDLNILGTTGIISLDDFVLNWTQGITLDNEGHSVGYTVRNKMAFPNNVQFVATPSTKTQQTLMIENFVALIQSGYGSERYRASIERSQKTQALLDAVWHKTMTPVMCA